MNIIEFLASKTIERYKPQIIGITGSVGKTLVREAIGRIFDAEGARHAWMKENDNSYRSMLYAILDPKPRELPLFTVFRSVLRLAFGGRYPRSVIVEYPLWGSKDLRSRLKLAKPDILVITGAGDFPIENEFNEGAESAFKDAVKLAESVSHHGKIIMNGDDKKLREAVQGKVKAKVMLFGFEEGDIKISSFENRTEAGRVAGITFKLEHQGGFVPVKLDNALGKFYAYASAAASLVGLSQGINLVKISEALWGYEGEPGRGKIMPGLKGTWIIDDTYDSSLWGVISALDLVKSLPAGRKIAVLGDVVGLGEKTEAAHREIGHLSAKIADVIITVGSRGKFIAEGAREMKFDDANLFSFDDAESAGVKLQELLRAEDLILIKGSGLLKMEKIVLEVMAEPLKARKLLVRR